MRTLNRRNYLKAIASALANLFLSRKVFGQNQPFSSEGESIQRQLRFIMTLNNPKSYELVDQILWFYLPVAETPTQQLESIKLSAPYERLTDSLGHSIIKLIFPQIAPLAAKIVSITINVSMRATPAMGLLKNPQDWLRPERYIEIADSGIRLLAAKLKRPEARETGLAIYEWIKQHLHYIGYIDDDRGAAYALNQLQGDCTEYAYLAVALARTNGIPARMVGGYTADKNAILRATDYHNWAELYFDGAWRLLDAQKERWLTPTEDYVAFHYYRDEDSNPIGLAHRYYQHGQFEVKY